MERHLVRVMLAAIVAQFATSGVASAQADTNRYPAMAPLSQYLIANRDAEIALARSAAPESISRGAEVMVLGRDGYATAATGANGFVCLVERSWGASTDAPEFWNPKIRAPHCFNPAARRTVVPLYLLKTKLLLAGKTKAEVVRAVAAALDSKEVPPLEPGAVVYMMSKQQYLNDQGGQWHPHIMIFVPGDAAASWGANQPGSPVIAVNDPEERATIMLFPVWAWSDRTPGPPLTH